MKQIKTIFENIKKAASEPTNEPTTTAKAIGSIQAYAEVGLNLIEENDQELQKELKNYESESRSRIKIVAFLASNGAKECHTIDEKLPFENASLHELKEAKRLLRKNLKNK